MQLTTSSSPPVLCPTSCSLFPDKFKADTCFEETVQTQINDHRPLESIKYHPVILPYFHGKFASSLLLNFQHHFLWLPQLMFFISYFTGGKKMKAILWDLYNLLITYFIWSYILCHPNVSMEEHSLLWSMASLSFCPGHHLLSLTTGLCSWKYCCFWFFCISIFPLDHSQQ